MKKLFFVLLIPFVFMMCSNIHAESKPEDKLIHDTLITSLSEHISEAIVNHYGYLKSYRLYDAEILSLKRLNGYTFQIKIRVKTFEHAHNPPYGKETITFEIKPSEINLIDFHHEGDLYEKQIIQFYKETLDDIRQSFNLDLSQFEMMSFRKVHHLSFTEEAYQSLFKILKDIVLNILNPAIHPPYKNTIDPLTFINDNEGYILFKKADGTNVIYLISKEGNHWLVSGQKAKAGKKMSDKLKWYM